MDQHGGIKLHGENSKVTKEIKDEPIDNELNSRTEEEMETNGTTKNDLKSETDDDDYDTCHSEASETEDEDEEEDEEDEDDELSGEKDKKIRMMKTEKITASAKVM